MTLYKITYEGIFEGDSEREAELYASRFRDEMQHTKTEKIRNDKDDLNFDITDDFHMFFESFVNVESEKFKNIDPSKAQLFLKDFDNKIKIFLTNLKESNLVGLVRITPDSIENPDKIKVVELNKDLIPLYMGAWIKQAEVEK